jgi:hypothetical protein
MGESILSDKARGAKIRAPVHFIWSKLGFPAATGDPLSLWKAWTHKLSGAKETGGSAMGRLALSSERGLVHAIARH